MPRKKSTIPPTTRVRENQRRSRARRKELIEELQGRIREYEEKEGKASLAMQVAARRVAWENTQLRHLLASKGVSPQEVERSLRERENIGAPHLSNEASSEELPRSILAQIEKDTAIQASNARSHSSLMLHEQNQEEHSNSEEVEDQIIAQSLSDEVNGEMPRLEEDVQASSPNMEQHNPIRATDVPEPILGYHTFGNEGVTELNNILHTVSDCSCPPSPASNSFAYDTLLEMSCETAATIISGMRENGDLERVRSQLGCEGSGHCNVKNLTVLQVMEID